jgi:lipopolysaccharide transport system permease protein
MSAGAATRVLVIEAPHGLPRLALGELWAHRELLGVLAGRDVKVRYRQTLLGAAWVLAQPLLGMLIFTTLFHRMARFAGPAGVPYALYVLAGLLPWNLIAAGVQGAGNSLITSAHLVSKVWFPRLVLPLSALLVALVDLGVAGLLLLGAMAFYDRVPPPAALLAPLAIALAAALALGVGLWLAALNVRYRDVRVLIPFLLQIWMYATPVAYPADVLPATLRALSPWNPATGAVEAFRAALLGTPLDAPALALSAALTALIVTSGAYAFRRAERSLADLL